MLCVLNCNLRDFNHALQSFWKLHFWNQHGQSEKQHEIGPRSNRYCFSFLQLAFSLTDWLHKPTFERCHTNINANSQAKPIKFHETKVLSWIFPVLVLALIITAGGNERVPFSMYVPSWWIEKRARKKKIIQKQRFWTQ